MTTALLVLPIVLLALAPVLLGIVYMGKRRKHEEKKVTKACAVKSVKTTVKKRVPKVQRGAEAQEGNGQVRVPGRSRTVRKVRRSETRLE